MSFPLHRNRPHHEHPPLPTQKKRYKLRSLDSAGGGGGMDGREGKKEKGPGGGKAQHGGGGDEREVCTWDSGIVGVCVTLVVFDFSLVVSLRFPFSSFLVFVSSSGWMLLCLLMAMLTFRFVVAELPSAAPAHPHRPRHAVLTGRFR